MTEDRAPVAGDGHERPNGNLSRSEFESLFDNVNDAIFIHDFDGHFLEVNAVACRRLGYSREELLQMVIKDINALDQSEKIPERLAKLKRDGHIVFDTEHRRRDGTIFPTEINSRLYEFRGRPAMLSVARDTTERQRLTAEIIQARKMESLGLLAGGLAHDLNNILGGVVGFASLIQQELPVGNRCHGYLEMIEASVEKAAALTGQLLALARQGPLPAQGIDLNRVVRDTLRMVESTFDRSISIETQLAAELPGLRGDEGQLGQAVMNLCLNARDAMPNGGTLRIATEAVVFSDRDRALLPEKAGDHGVALIVSDTGPGIASEIQARIFDPFFTTKAPGKGTGLGLSTVHWVIKNHGGYCRLESEPGKGSTFRIFLPGRGLVQEPVEASKRESRGHGEVLLLVDDDEILRLAYRTILEDNGYRVLCAADGSEACEIYGARGEEVALVLLDVVMPRMGGWECLAGLKRLDPNAKVLLISGYDPEHGGGGDMLGTVGWLRKPFGAEKLRNEVRRAIDEPVSSA